MSKRESHKGESNEARAKAVQELRRSNAAGTHLDKRTKRKRTRAARNTEAKREFE